MTEGGGVSGVVACECKFGSTMFKAAFGLAAEVAAAVSVVGWSVLRWRLTFGDLTDDVDDEHEWDEVGVFKLFEMSSSARSVLMFSNLEF